MTKLSRSIEKLVDTLDDVIIDLNVDLEAFQIDVRLEFHHTFM